MGSELQQRVAALLGREPVDWHPVHGGYTPAERWIASFSDGSSVFVKGAVDPDTAEWLRTERHVYASLDAAFLPRLVAWDDGEFPILVVEDLRGARWPPPWLPGDVARVVSTVDQVAAAPLDRVPRFERFEGWQEVADDPRPFLSLGMCSPDWLERALPTLLEAEASAITEGEDLLHCDVRSDNICFAGDRVVLVDWNWVCRGNRRIDVAFLAASVRLEGGPLPEETSPDSPELAAMVAGYFSSRAGLPSPPKASRVRWIQLRQARIALPWVCRALGLPQPDGRWAQAEIDEADKALATGRIDEAQWYAATEEALADAYLASDDPRAQSGKSGDEVDWRWSRELVLDACRDGDAVLDVGCANGYLMESMERWGAERGLTIDPYGLEISWRLAALARVRIPERADRIFEGNVMDWPPPRRFDVVHTGLDYAPPGRRRELVERILRDFLEPGGRLVVRPERVRDHTPDVPAQLRALGFEVAGVLEAVHPQTRDLRRTAWLGP